MRGFLRFLLFRFRWVFELWTILADLGWISCRLIAVLLHLCLSLFQKEAFGMIHLILNCFGQDHIFYSFLEFLSFIYFIN